ncbi:MAG: hypothetical protein JRG92_14315 [Deltaproteobacteria bacterium]|nr:hypothetical protein [Deltaproteobacteria bacterium]
MQDRGFGTSLGPVHTRRLLAIALFLVLLVSPLAPVAAATLIEQVWDGSAAGVPSRDGTTQNDNADDIFVPEIWRIESATWVGMFLLPETAGATRDFVIEIFADDAGEPSLAPIQTVSVSATSTLLAPPSGANVNIYSFDATFDPPIMLGTGHGGRYYFSVNDAGWVSATYGMLWGLSFAATDTRWYRIDDSNPWTEYSTGNLAFALYGDTLTPSQQVTELIWQQEGDPPTYRWKVCESCAFESSPAPLIQEDGFCSIDQLEELVDISYSWLVPPIPPADGFACCAYLECQSGQVCTTEATEYTAELGWGSFANESGFCTAPPAIPSMSTEGPWLLAILMIAASSLVALRSRQQNAER